MNLIATKDPIAPSEVIPPVTSGVRAWLRDHPHFVAALIAFAVVIVSMMWKASCHIEGQYLRSCYTDLSPLYATTGLDAGQVPYFETGQPRGGELPNTRVEYPVLTGLFMFVASIPVATSQGFLVANGILLAFCAAIAAWFLSKTVGLTRTLRFAASPLLLVHAVVNWDLLTVAFAAWASYAFLRGNDRDTGIAVGLGTAAKLYPAVMALPFLLAAWRLRGRASAVRFVVWSAVAWGAVNLPVILGAFDEWRVFLDLNSDRVANWETIWYFFTRVTGVWIDVTVLNWLSLITTLAVIAGVMWFAWRNDPPATWHHTILPILAGWLLANKVYSPQYTLWLLVPIVLAHPSTRSLWTFVVADVLVTATLFPFLATAVGQEGGIDYGWLAVCLWVRGIALVWVAWSGWRRAVAAESDGSMIAGQLRVAGADVARA